MSIWNKVLIGFIFVASVVFFYMAARTLKTHQYWRKLAQRFEERIQHFQEENRLLVEAEGEGKDEPAGIKRLRRDLHHLLIDRGRVWYSCSPGRVDGQTGAVAVTTDRPSPHGISDKTVLYVFEEAEVNPEAPAQGGQYLGEFRVTQVNPPSQVGLEPLRKLEPGSQELQRLLASQGPWSLYEVMPIDNHETFAGKVEEQLKELLPAESVPGYLHDGRQITTDDAEQLGLEGKLLALDENDEVVYVDENGEVLKIEVDDTGQVVYVDRNGKVVKGARVVEKEQTEGKGMYVRPLRDYDLLFKSYYVQRAVLSDRIKGVLRDQQYIEAAVADARKQVQFRQAEELKLQADLADYRRQRDEVADHRDQLRRAVDAYRDSIKRTIAQNKAAAGKIAKAQSEAAQRIDARTRRMVQSTAGAN